MRIPAVAISYILPKGKGKEVPSVLILGIWLAKRVSIPYPECGDNGVEQTPTNPESDWLETEVIAGFRVWQILFLVCAGMGTLVIVACCVTRWRIPHTRQEIEANHRRNQITQLFRCHLDRLTVDEVDLLWGECLLVLFGSRCDHGYISIIAILEKLEVLERAHRSVD
ncbi:uncharacterized protein TNCV_2630161 [Trichonephila clavipes]|uniref:Uncharacterized protein n=1 Tax=Trichonephila clavipes TaxID=2585209 RepID=A0A8X6VF49_TRICX|nr:uncharacterized protein TNCV_2630161 [Trichonephila clavipes]